MEEQHIFQTNKYFFFIILTILIIVSYFIIKPFIISLLSAFILSYLIKPIFNRVAAKTGKPLASLICIVGAILVLVIPLILIISKLVQELSQALDPEVLKEAFESLFSIPLLDQLNVDPYSLAKTMAPYLFSILTYAITEIGILIIAIFVTLVSTYYMLKDWDYFTLALVNYIPFKNKREVSKEIGEATYNIIYGYAMVALIEFVISLIGFYLSGVKFFVFLPFLIAIFAFIPGLGPLVVWAPLAAFYVLTNNYPIAIGVIITGLIVSIGIDTILSPKLVGKKSKIHPLIMLVGVLGGIALFGIFGFIIGPLILVYTIKLIEEALKQS